MNDYFEEIGLGRHSASVRVINRAGLNPTPEEHDLAQRVAARYSNAQVGTIHFTDSDAGIQVWYHPFKHIAFTLLESSKIYFGYGIRVDFKARRKGIQLYETSPSEDNWRSVVASTDGEELASAPLSEIRGTSGGTPLIRLLEKHGTLAPRFDNPLTGSNVAWLGGNTIPYFDDFYHYYSFGTNPPPTNFAPDIDAIFQGYLDLDIEDDVCYDDVIDLRARDYPTRFYYQINFIFQIVQVFINVGLANNPAQANSRIMSLQIRFQQVNGGSILFQDLGSTIIPSTVDPYITAEYLAAWEQVASILADADYARHGNYVVTSARESLERQVRFRKKWSDSRIAMLRGGTLPIEFEDYVKIFHPYSLNLRRGIPLEIVSSNYTLVSDVTTTSPTIRTRVYEGVVSLRYATLDENGIEQQIEESFTGTLTHVQTNHIPGTISYVWAYENFPLLANTAGDAFLPFGNPFPQPHPYQSAFREMESSILRDPSNQPIFVIANGTAAQSIWVADDKYGTPNYRPGEYTPPIPVSTDDVVLTHPQFIYDYIQASKPIEFETIDGEKQPVAPSADWLSSKLTDKETITVIPLSFATSLDDEVGMFPHSDCAPFYDGNYDFDFKIQASAKIYGFARYQFDYATSTFTFKDWTEFTTDGKVKVSDSIEHAYNDELNPTTLTVGDKTYTLEPIVIDCESEWINTNCVFIGDKTPWTDTKEAAKEQASHIGANPPADYELTPEERLYKAIREAIK